MIEIKLADKEKVRQICAQGGLTCPDTAQVYLMTDGGEEAGWCIFDIEKDWGSLLLVRVQEEGLLLADGLVRASLSLMFDRGVHIAKAALSLLGAGGEKRAAVLLRRIGFAQNEDGWFLELNENFFKGHCG